MSENKPLVSIITPSYNSSEYISETLDSIIAQSYQDWELIIIDDCSTDNTIVIVQQFQKNDARIKLIKLQMNSGPAKARNEGIKHSLGRYIAFCDSDDIWLPNKLEEQLYFMQINNVNFCHTSYGLFDEKGNFLNKRTIAPISVSYNDLIKYNWIGTSTVIYSCKKLGKFYMPNIRNRQDWALWLAITKNEENALFLDKPLAKYIIRENSISKKKAKLIKYHWIIYRKIEGFSSIKALFYLIINLFNHLKKNKIINA